MRRGTFIILIIIFASFAPTARASTKVLPEITHGNTSKKQVIFTFDGGASALSASTILGVLDKHKVKSTFFLTGIFIKLHPDLVKQMLSAGHEVFSHTFDHKALPTLSSAKIVKELGDTEEALQATAGTSTKPYFRPPYGARNSRVLAAATRAGYQAVYWTVDALDWKEKQGVTGAQVKERIISKLAPGNIYLMHLGTSITGNILDDVFSKIEGQGYKIVSLKRGL